MKKSTAKLQQNEGGFSFVEDNKNYYLLDASAVLKYPDLTKYPEYFDIITPAVFIMTPDFLNEVDKGKFKNTIEPQREFVMSLIKFAEKGKLSQRVEIASKTEVLFYKEKNLRLDFGENGFEYLDDTYVDKWILIFASKIRKKTKNISIISRDGIMRVICGELDPPICYVFADKEKPSTDEDNMASASVKDKLSPIPIVNENRISIDRDNSTQVGT